MAEGCGRTWRRSGYGVTFLYFTSPGLTRECEAAKCLLRACPVQYFILKVASGLRGVSGEEQWENVKGTCIPAE